MSCLSISSAESNIVPYVSKFLSTESKSLHNTSIKNVLFLFIYVLVRSHSDIWIIKPEMIVLVKRVGLKIVKEIISCK